MNMKLSAWTLAAALLLPLAAQAQAPAKAPIKDPEFCLTCHDDLTDEKVVHPAIRNGCLDCHTNLDASVRPHKNSGKLPHGLDAKQPDLCLSCHGKLVANKKLRHPAIDMGCTGCHDQHSGKNPRMLKALPPDLCFKCHDKDDFNGKFVHGPVKAGQCVTCHEPHASDNANLLKKPGAQMCLECHDDIKDAPHMLAGFSRKGHPIGDEKRPQPTADPLRKGKLFYCASCHEPHRSDFDKMRRFDPNLGMGVCQKCHDK